MKERSKARRFAVQAIYQWLMTEDDIKEITAQFFTDHEMGKKTDTDYFTTLLQGAVNQRDTLHQALTPHIQRELDELDPVEHAILLLAAYEMKDHIEVPYRVVINEAVELSKLFGSSDGHKFVNGVLDKLAADMRTVEVEARKKQNR